MATINSSGQDYRNNADGFELSGGTTKRKLSVQGGDTTLTGGANTLSLAGNLTTAGGNAVTLTTVGSTAVTVSTTGTLATLTGTEDLTNKIVSTRAGSTASGSAPIKFTTGTLLTSAEVGAVEFDSASDKLMYTQTTSSTRRVVATYPSSGSTGDMFYRDGSSNFVPLTIGSTGQVLTVAGGLPAWAASGSSSAAGIQWPIDDPSNWTASIGYDQEFNATSSSPPSTPTTWSWVNQVSGTTWTEASGAGVIYHPGNAGDSYRGIFTGLPSPTAWTATAKLIVNGANVNYTAIAVALRDSVSGKMYAFLNDNSAKSMVGQNWNSPTSWSGNVHSNVYMDFPRYYRVSRTSTTSYTFQYSTDGIGWVTMASGYNPTGFVTPNQIGLIMNRSSTAAASMSAYWFRVR